MNRTTVVTSSPPASTYLSGTTGVGSGSSPTTLTTGTPATPTNTPVAPTTSPGVVTVNGANKVGSGAGVIGFIAGLAALAL